MPGTKMNQREGMNNYDQGFPNVFIEEIIFELDFEEYNLKVKGDLTQK